MTVLVTGATGFIGSHVARLLLQRGDHVRALVREGSVLRLQDSNLEPVSGDLRDRQAVARAVQGCQQVFHVAALYTFWQPVPQVIYDINVGGTRNVLEAAVEAGVERIVYTSTVATIRFSRNGSLATEEMESTLKEMEGHYKCSKYLAELETRRMAAHGLPVVIVNPTLPVGPGDAKPSPTGRTMVDFLRGRMPAYTHTGLNLVDVEDVALGHLLAMEKGRIGHRYLLGNRNVTLREFFEMIAQITGRSAPRLRIPYWLALTLAYADAGFEGRLLHREPRIPLEGARFAKKLAWVDCSKAIRELGLSQTPVEQALEKAVRWFQDNGYANS